MTDENRKLLERINAYAENTLGEIDPQKVPVSLQLEKLRPVMEEIAAEKSMKMEDVFIWISRARPPAPPTRSSRTASGISTTASTAAHRCCSAKAADPIPKSPLRRHTVWTFP